MQACSVACIGLPKEAETGTGCGRCVAILVSIVDPPFTFLVPCHPALPCSQTLHMRRTSLPTLSRFEVLHQGLYLGFKGLRAISDPKIQDLWHSASCNVTTFEGPDTGNRAMSNMDSLFNMGAMFATAGREVAFIGKTGSAENITTLPSALFMHKNGPSTMHTKYLHSLNLMVGDQCM